MKARLLEEKLMLFLMYAATGLILLTLAMIIGTVFWKGLPAMNLDMITKTPQGGFYLGREGGILNAIVGSLYLSLGAVALAACLALPLTLLLNTGLKNRPRLAGFIRLVFDVMSGVPSIVFGALGFTVMIFLGLRVSLLAGIVTVALLILPLTVRTIDESMRLVPSELLDSSQALGATRLETALRVLLRQVLPAILTGLLVSLGRAIGDAASILFTAGFTDHIPESLSDPVATLPLAIFFQLSSPLPEVRERAYASAFILTLLILLISLLARMVMKRFSRNVID